MDNRILIDSLWRMPVISLYELAAQSRIPQIEFLNRKEIINELMDDYNEDWDEAIEFDRKIAGV